MDATIETLDTIINDADLSNIEDFNFGKEIAKTIAISAATTAGMIVGALAVGYAANKVDEFKKKRAVKKTTSKTTKIDCSDKIPANETH